MLPPMALVFKSSATVSLMGKVAVGGAAMVAGSGPRHARYFCTRSPFVFEMSREGDRIVATRMDILARRVTHEFREADVKREPTTLRPFVTFEADGEWSIFVTKSGFRGRGGRGFGREWYANVKNRASARRRSARACGWRRGGAPRHRPAAAGGARP